MANAAELPDVSTRAFALALTLCAPSVAFAAPVDDAIARYVTWRGAPAFSNATSVLMRGTLDNARFRGDLERRIEPGRTVERLTVGSAVAGGL